MNKATHNVTEILKWISRDPSMNLIKYSSYLVDGIHFNTKECENIRTTQNSGVSIIAKTMQFSNYKDKNPVESDMTFYGVIREIWKLDYITFQLPVFLCDWVEINNSVREYELGFTLVNLNRICHKNDPFILATQAKPVFYINDSLDA